MLKKIILLSLALILFSSNLLAAQISQTKSYIKLSATNPSSGETPYRVDFFQDTQKCDEMYGNSSYDICVYLPSLTGQDTRNIKVEPAFDGQIVWDYSSLYFYPNTSWQADTTYTVSFGDKIVPNKFELDRTILTFKTNPLAATLKKSELFIDPSTKGEHVYSASIAFLYPMDRAEVEKNLSINVTGVKVSSKDLVWNQKQTELVINLAIKDLAQGGEIEIYLAKYASYIAMYEDVEVKVDKPLRITYKVSAKQGALKILDTKVVLNQNDKLEQEYKLVINTNASINPKELLKKMRVAQLPKYRDVEGTIAFEWNKAPNISKEEIAAAKELALTPSSFLDKNILEFTFKPETDSYFCVEIDKDLQSTNGLTLAQDQLSVLQTPNLLRQISILQKGNILSVHNGSKLELLSSGNDEIQVDVRKILPAYYNLFAGTSFSIEYPNAYYDSLSSEVSDNIILPKNDGQNIRTTLDLEPYMQGKGILRLNLLGYSKDGRVTSDMRYIILSDLALVVKVANDRSFDVFVCDLVSGLPKAGVTLNAVMLNGQVLSSALSDASGYAKLKNIATDKQASYPTVITASLGDDFTYMPLNDGDRVVNYSKFPNIGQNYNAMNAYIINQRGIYRPGETVYFASIVKDIEALPQGLPLYAKLWDSRGTLLNEWNFKLGENAFNEFSYTLSDYAATGNYEIDISYGSHKYDQIIIGSTRVRVEEFQPDSLALKMTIPLINEHKAWLPKSLAVKDFNVKLDLQNLYGQAAKDRKVSLAMSVNPIQLVLADFKDYVFYQRKNSQMDRLQINLPNGITDANGQAIFDLKLDELRQGTYEIELLAEGFEPGGGRAVTKTQRFVVSDEEFALAYKTLANLNFIPQDKATSLNFVAFNSNLEMVDLENLSFEISQNEMVTALIKDYNGLYKYEQNVVPRVLSQKKVDLIQDQLNFELDSSNIGNFTLTVYNKNKDVLHKIDYTIIGNSALLTKNTDYNKLNVHTEKENYASGETVKMMISSSFDGIGLITLESDQVLSHSWFNAKAGDSLQEIVIPEGFEGKAYINVSYAKSIDSPDIYTQSYAYALTSINVGIEKRRLDFKLTAQPRYKSGELAQVEISANKKIKALVFAVDEGVLQLTNYKTPNPLNYFYLDKALGVQTMQAFDLLMPQHKQVLAKLSAFGGDMSTVGGRFHNPFKRKNEAPLVYWSGIIDLDNESKTLTFNVPEYYNGKIRIMAVALDDFAMSSQEQSALVQQDIVITPQIPLFMRPNDQVQAVFALSKDQNSSHLSSEYALTWTISPAIKVLNELPSTIVLDAGQDVNINLELVAQDILGTAEIKLEIQNLEQNFTRAVSLVVSPISPKEMFLQSSTFSKKAELQTEREIYAFEADTSLSVSSIPLAQVMALSKYINTYPYACTEQMISKAFSNILMINYPNYYSEQAWQELQKTTTQSVEQAISAIRSRNYDGGLGLWEDYYGDNNKAQTELLSAYALDFMIEAKSAGYAVPSDLINSVSNYLDEAARNSVYTIDEARARAYNIWQLTRLGYITTQYLEELNYFISEYPEYAGDIATAMMAASYKLLHLDNDAFTKIGKVESFELKNYQKTWLFDINSSLALYAAINAKYFGVEQNIEQKDWLIENILLLNQNSYSTFSSVMSIRALLDLSKATKSQLKDLNITCLDSDASNLNSNEFLVTLSAPLCTKFSLENKNDNTLYYQIMTDGYSKKILQDNYSQGLEIKREYLNAQGEFIDLAKDSVKLGDIITVLISAKSYESELEDIVIADLIPAGFEILLDQNDDNRTMHPMQVNHFERREDRILLFTTINNDESTYKYQVRATNLGEFTLPNITASSMYDQDIKASFTNKDAKLRVGK